MDSLTPVQRRKTMAAVKSTNTKPELAVRAALHSAGFRYRLHRKDLPGTPDIVLPKYRAVIFVHGCFWHQHDNCKAAARPTSRIDYWNEKLNRNLDRDRRHITALEALGWRVLVVWECETRKFDVIQDRLRRFLLENG